ncbi:MAG: class I SAM-dependent methyltransferase [Candidatus Kerfeldbacteria bacterium]
MNKPQEETASWNYAELWDKFPPPARPSKEELEYLEKELRPLVAANPDIKLLILGSTIEYRSLCKKLGIKPYVVDFKKEHFDTLSEYADEKFEDEHFIEADWLHLEGEDTYDIIIGHRPYNVIRHGEIEQLFRVMHKVLKPGGVFYCKGNMINPDAPDRLEQIREQWTMEENREYPLFSYIEVELYTHTAGENGYVDYPKARKIINDWFEQEKISQEDYDLAKLLVSMDAEAQFRNATKDEIDSGIEAAGFSSSEQLVLDKEICENMPIIKLTK